MKCPKCKKEMKIVEQIVGFSLVSGAILKDRLICINEKCEYYGIPRFDLRDEKWEKEKDKK
jgi:hypothetical protein